MHKHKVKCLPKTKCKTKQDISKVIAETCGIWCMRDVFTKIHLWIFYFVFMPSNVPNGCQKITVLQRGILQYEIRIVLSEDSVSRIFNIFTLFLCLSTWCGVCMVPQCVQVGLELGGKEQSRAEQQREGSAGSRRVSGASWENKLPWVGEAAAAAATTSSCCMLFPDDPTPSGPLDPSEVAAVVLPLPQQLDCSSRDQGLRPPGCLGGSSVLRCVSIGEATTRSPDDGQELPGLLQLRGRGGSTSTDRSFVGLWPQLSECQAEVEKREGGRTERCPGLGKEQPRDVTGKLSLRGGRHLEGIWARVVELTR